MQTIGSSRQRNLFPAGPPLCFGETVFTSTKRSVETGGVQLQVTEAGDRGAPVVVLAHGFPELAYSWRHQIPALAAAGYHVLAPDQRGYGGSSRPPAIADYDIVHLTGDLAGLLDDVGAEQAVVVGHDWGSVVATGFPLFHPDRVRGVVALSVPPIPRPPEPPTQIWRRIFGDEFCYPLHFQAPGIADAEFGRDVRESLLRTFAMEVIAAPVDVLAGRPLPPLPDWLTEDEFEQYVAAFTGSGFTGPLNWYRNFDRNWELTERPPAASITVPTLFLGGDADPLMASTPRDRVRTVATGEYREILFPGAGHWLQQERPGEVNAVLLEFLEGLK